MHLAEVQRLPVLQAEYQWLIGQGFGTKSPRDNLTFRQRRNLHWSTMETQLGARTKVGFVYALETATPTDI